MNGHVWCDLTTWEYLYLKRAEGLTDSEIANLKHISTSSLSRWKKREGIKAGRTTEEYERLEQLGYTPMEIAKRWRISQSAMWQFRSSRGLL